MKTGECSNDMFITKKEAKEVVKDTLSGEISVNDIFPKSTN